MDYKITLIAVDKGVNLFVFFNRFINKLLELS